MGRVPVHVSVADPATGNALAGVSALVKNRVTGASASLFSAETGGAVVSNPLTTDAAGRGFAWTENAPLQIDYSGTGLTPFSEYRDAQRDFVSSLPGSPYDGQDVFYQSAGMASLGVVWHLRYRSGASGSYKWEFVGGGDLRAGVASEANETTGAFSWEEWNTPITVTVPLAGDYEVTFTGNRILQNTSASSVYAQLQVSSGTLLFQHADAGYGNMTAQWMGIPFALQDVVTGISASGTIKGRRQHASASAQVNYANAAMIVRPVRVG